MTQVTIMTMVAIYYIPYSARTIIPAVKPGANRITAKYECEDNPASKSFSSVNVTGV